MAVVVVVVIVGVEQINYFLSKRETGGGFFSICFKKEKKNPDLNRTLESFFLPSVLGDERDDKKPASLKRDCHLLTNHFILTKWFTYVSW